MKHVMDQKKNESPVVSKKPFSVFIVDDDESYLSALGFRLMKDNKDHQTKVYCYTSGEECLANLDLDPRVVILDYYLSTNQDAMSGLEVLREIKRIKPNVPVVVLSSQGDIKTALDTFEEGAYTYVVKDKQALLSIEKIIDSFINIKPTKLRGPY
ncbi:MAG TPA: response regulator [Bacteroidia bacterium]|nr:response regulator [Bacteroidia bacterium]